MKKHSDLLIAALRAPSTVQTKQFGVAYTTGIIKRLKKEKTYRFIHRRKGTFVARYMTQRRDVSGDILLRVIIDTSQGSGAEHLANAKMYSTEGVKLQPNVAEKWLRAKLVQSIEELLNGHC